MMRTFYGRHNQKIRGVTFHHRSLKRSSRLKSKLNDFFEYHTLYSEIERETPTPLSQNEIRYFLCDQGRNEIHTHVAICVEFISKWSGILKIIERCFLQNITKENMLESSLAFVDELDATCSTELEIFLSAKRVLSLWQHRLRIFEMITEAQGSLRNLPNYTLNRLKAYC